MPRFWIPNQPSLSPYWRIGKVTNTVREKSSTRGFRVKIIPLVDIPLCSYVIYFFRMSIEGSNGLVYLGCTNPKAINYAGVYFLVVSDVATLCHNSGACC